jgi:hypothetical protein
MKSVVSLVLRVSTLQTFAPTLKTVSQAAIPVAVTALAVSMAKAIVAKQISLLKSPRRFLNP